MTLDRLRLPTRRLLQDNGAIMGADSCSTVLHLYSSRVPTISLNLSDRLIVSLQFSQSAYICLPLREESASRLGSQGGRDGRLLNFMTHL